MLHIGLTGNIASGKSTVAHMLQEHGATVVDSDLLAREAVEPGTPALAAIRARFGDAVISADGTLNRNALGRIVFGDAEARSALNAIVHPEVGRLRLRAVERARAAGAAVVVSDIPLLFETGLADEFDAVVLVDAPERERFRRLVTLRDLPEADARAMMSAQWPSAEKRARSAYVIDNDGSLAQLAQRVDAVWSAIVARGAGAGALTE